MTAAQHGRYVIVQMLLAHAGTDVNLQAKVKFHFLLLWHVAQYTDLRIGIMRPSVAHMFLYA